MTRRLGPHRTPTALVVVTLLLLTGCDDGAGPLVDTPTPGTADAGGDTRGAVPPVPLRPGETLRAERSGTGADREEIPLADVPDVFVVHTVCAPGVRMVVEATSTTNAPEEFDTVCDGVISSRTTIHDPAESAYDTLDIVVEGDGAWAVALADTTQPATVDE